jgi:hypothetical protein
MNARPRWPRVLCLSIVGTIFAAQLVFSLVYSLHRRAGDHDLPELLSLLPVGSQGFLPLQLAPARQEDDRSVATVALPERWHSVAATPDRPRWRVFVDGQGVRLRQKPPRPERHVTPPGEPYALVDPHWAELTVACPASAPCKTAVVVADDFWLALAVARSRTLHYPLPPLMAVAALAVWAALALWVWRSAGVTQLVLGCGAFLLAAIAWERGEPRVADPSPAVLVGATLALASPLLLQPLWLRLRPLVRRIPPFVLRDLFFAHDPRAAPRPAWWRVLSLATIATIPFGLLVSTEALGPPERPFPGDRHRNESLDIALNRVFCGTTSSLSATHSVAAYLDEHPEHRHVALREVAERLAGSSEAYCASIVTPILNNENSLMLAMAFSLRLEPHLSLHELGWRLQAVRLLAVFLFVVGLLQSGSSLASAALVFVLFLGVFEHMSDRHYSVYPFVPALLFVTIAWLALCLTRRLSGPGLVAGAAVAGWIVAFAVNMRTSHLPVYVTLIALFLLAAHRALSPKGGGDGGSGRWLWLGAAALGAAASYGLFSLFFIRPLAKAPGEGPTYAYHVVMHPVVLGLALPPNPLSLREGIGGSDLVGHTLAQRVDPGVAYLREGYEQALFRYYLGLWARHPDEMLAIYKNKFLIAGRHIVSALGAEDPFKGQPLARAVILPVAWLPNGLALLALYVVAFGLAGAAHLRWGAPLGFLAALVMAAAGLLYLESALIDPFFVLSHQSSQLVCLFFLGLLSWQLLLESLRVVMTSVAARIRMARVSDQGRR